MTSFLNGQIYRLIWRTKNEKNKEGNKLVIGIIRDRDVGAPPAEKYKITIEKISE
jgi:hypothetical protein